MSADDFEGLIQYFQRRPKVKAWHIVILAELIGDRIGEKLVELKPPEVPPILRVPPIPPPEIPVLEIPKIPVPPKPVTRTIDWKEKRAEFELSLFDVKVGGTLQELMLKSPSKNYSIALVTDGSLKLQKTFEEMEVVGQYLDTIAAFEKNGEYILHLKDYSWLESAYSVISVKEPIVFSNVFIKWDELIS